ncbi:uncharacterized protein LOC121857541 [Homarus americanus]|uniref:uncharacterized protein LOC121857541 n=1 Tax=Homarus americanus TaxID=6706 RepID=UPI001C475E02|nr:uncharacterized protein LOC121857541 [Homarus americanus]
MAGSKVKSMTPIIVHLLYLTAPTLPTTIPPSEVTITNLHVPPYARLGDSVVLECYYKTPWNLYSLKWYFDDREFLRYKPEEGTSLLVLPLPGVNVDTQLSTHEKIVLKDVQLSSSGKYKCEVIGEWPTFHTADKSSYMDVLGRQTNFSGTKYKYHIGDLVKLTCSSPRSRPPAHLTWFINGDQVPTEYLVPINSTRYPNGLVQMHLGLSFLVANQHFHTGELKLRCSAGIDSLYYKTQEHSVAGEVVFDIPVLESRGVAGVSGG